jgi:hypothetical protein
MRVVSMLRLLIMDAVDPDQGAVEDRVRQSADPFYRRIQVVGGCGEQVDGLADIPPGGYWTAIPSPQARRV